MGMATKDIANPSEEHLMLREMVREWTQEHVEPQALEHDRDDCLLYTSPSPRDG